MTFREAHDIVGKMVLAATDQGKELHEFTLDKMKDFTSQIDEDVYEWLDPSACLEKRNIPGGTGPEMVRKSLNKAKEELKN